MNPRRLKGTKRTHCIHIRHGSLVDVTNYFWGACSYQGFDRMWRFRHNLVIGKFDRAHSINIDGSHYCFLPLTCSHGDLLADLERMGFKPEISVVMGYVEPGCTFGLDCFRWLARTYHSSLVIGDVHHLQNPYSFSYEISSQSGASEVLMASSPHVGALITSSSGIASRLYPYRILHQLISPQKASEASQETAWDRSFTYIGDIMPPFHPRRSQILGKLKIASADIRYYRRTKNTGEWLRILRETNGLYIYAGIAGQLSNHLIYPLFLGVPLLVDEVTATNPYWSEFLVDEYSCIVYGPKDSGQAIRDKCSRHDLGLLSRSARVLASGVFGSTASEDIFGIDLADRFNMVHSRLVSSFRALAAHLERKQWQLLFSVCDILQEQNRVTLDPVRIYVQTRFGLESILEQICTFYPYLEWVNQIPTDSDLLSASHICVFDDHCFAGSRQRFQHFLDYIPYETDVFVPSMVASTFNSTVFPEFPQRLHSGSKLWTRSSGINKRGSLVLTLPNNNELAGVPHAG